MVDGGKYSHVDEMFGICATCEYVAMVDVTNKTTWPHVFYFDPVTQDRVMKGGGQECENQRNYKYSSTDDAFQLDDDVVCCNEPNPEKICKNGFVRGHDPNTGLSIDIRRGEGW